MRCRFALTVVGLVGLASVANGQPPSSTGPAEQNRLTLPETIVRGEAPQTPAPATFPTTLEEAAANSETIGFNTPVGPYGQPEWTTKRPFPTTRIYVLPPGEADFEQWVRPTWNRDGTADYRFLEEVSIGLPGRFQLDVYERWNTEPNAVGVEEVNHEGVQIELRYAFADWGDLPLNPTLYMEWFESGGPQHKPDTYELKLLLGTEVMPQLLYATNLYIEQEISGDRETELGWSQGIGVPLVDEKWMLSLETLLSSTTVQGGRDNPAVSFTLGPSLQWRPTKCTFVDVVGLFGTTSDSPTIQMYVVLGYQFGQAAGPTSAINSPTSTRGR